MTLEFSRGAGGSLAALGTGMLVGFLVATGGVVDHGGETAEGEDRVAVRRARRARGARPALPVVVRPGRPTRRRRLRGSVGRAGGGLCQEGPRRRTTGSVPGLRGIHRAAPDPAAVLICLERP